MESAGLLLTGGRSARMGTDKAALRLPSSGIRDREPMSLTLAERTAQLLEAATKVALEVGPGFSHLRRVAESPPQSGPLAALVAGAAELARIGWSGPVLLVATDMPRLNSGMLGWLATHQPGRSVVPLSRGVPQPLCARYEPEDLAAASRLLAGGSRSMASLIEEVEPQLVPEDTWARYAGDPLCLDDVDTPDQLDAHEGGLG